MSEKAGLDTQLLDGISVYDVLFNYPRIVVKAPLRNLFDSNNPILFSIRTAFLDKLDDVLSQTEWLRYWLIVKDDIIETGDLEEKDLTVIKFEDEEVSSLRASLIQAQKLLEWSFFDLSQVDVLEAYVSHLNLTGHIRETAKGEEYKRLVTTSLSSTIVRIKSPTDKSKKRRQTVLGVEKKYTESIAWKIIVRDFCYCDKKGHDQHCENKFKKSWVEDVRPFLEKHALFEQLPSTFQQSKKNP